MPQDIIFIIFQIIILIFSVVIHEVSHGAAANSLGDPTARLMGRLTLNPIKHLDFFGSFLVPLFFIILNQIFGGGFIFGWAKPVPINPYNLRDQRWGPALVGAAGPASNVFIALVFGFTMRFFQFPQEIMLLFAFIVFINLILAVINLLPVPPLDGSRILFSLLPKISESAKMMWERFGLIAAFLVIFLLLNPLITLVFYLFRLIVGRGVAF